jgi:hypothetical protein
MVNAQTRVRFPLPALMNVKLGKVAATTVWKRGTINELVEPAVQEILAPKFGTVLHGRDSMTNFIKSSTGEVRKHLTEVLRGSTVNITYHIEFLFGLLNEQDYTFNSYHLNIKLPEPTVLIA